MIGYLKARRIAKRRLLRYPEDAHVLPRWEGMYLCYPDWMHRRRLPFDVLFRLAAWYAETFNGGRYCFTVDRNKEERDLMNTYIR